MMQIIIGSLYAFTSGTLVTINSIIIAFLQLDYADCLLARFSLQFIVFTTILFLLNLQHSAQEDHERILQQPYHNDEGTHRNERILLWNFRVDDGNNIHVIRTLLLLQGAFTVVGILGMCISVLYIPVGDAGTIVGSTFIPATLFSWICLGKNAKLYKISCCLCALTGIVLIVKPPMIFGSAYPQAPANSTGMGVKTNGALSSGNDTYFLGVSMAIISTTCKALSTVTVGYLYKNTTIKSPCLIGLYASLAGLAIAFAAAPFDGDHKIVSKCVTDITPLCWAGLSGVALFGVYGGYCRNKSVELIGPILDSFIRALDILVAYGFQVLFFHEPVSSLAQLGATCVMASIALISLEETIIRKIPDCTMKSVL